MLITMVLLHTGKSVATRTTDAAEHEASTRHISLTRLACTYAWRVYGDMTEEGKGNLPGRRYASMQPEK
jgi:hypothetical protein